MDETLVKTYAKLTLHEFLLEVLYANWLNELPAGAGHDLLNDLSERVRYRTYAPADQDADQDAMFEIQTSAAAMMDAFAVKVRRRAEALAGERVRTP